MNRQPGGNQQDQRQRDFDTTSARPAKTVDTAAAVRPLQGIVQWSPEGGARVRVQHESGRE